MKTKIKTIDIQAKEWFDKSAGNSYFSGDVCINMGTKTERCYRMPFQYGYENQYKHEAGKILIKNKEINEDPQFFVLWRYCAENKIILRSNIQMNCKKKELL